MSGSGGAAGSIQTRRIGPTWANIRSGVAGERNLPTAEPSSRWSAVQSGAARPQATIAASSRSPRTAHNANRRGASSVHISASSAANTSTYCPSPQPWR